eukprot:415970_1
MDELFAHLPANFEYFDFTGFVFVKLLDVNFQCIDQSLKETLKQYIIAINRFDDNDTTHNLSFSNAFGKLLSELSVLVSDAGRFINLESLTSSVSDLISNVCTNDKYLEKYFIAK